MTLFEISRRRECRGRGESVEGKEIEKNRKMNERNEDWKENRKRT